jgi:hypothetical protein
MELPLASTKFAPEIPPDNTKFNDAEFDNIINLLDNNESDFFSKGVLAPPPEGTYLIHERAVKDVQKWARDHGYAVCFKRHNHNQKGELEAIYMVCDRNGKPSFRGTGKRVTSSVKTNCPFNIRISYRQDTELWHLVVRNARHNHAPAPESTIVQHQQLEMRQKLPKINKQLASRVPNRKILQQLQREDPTSIIQSTDIRNHQHQELKQYLGGRTVLQALIQDFKNHEDWVL